MIQNFANGASNATVLISNVKLSAGTLSSLRTDVTFGDSNGVSFGLNAAGVITASINAAAGGTFAGTGFTTATTAGANIVGTLTTNGLSMGVPAYLTTAALSQDSSKYAGTGFTTATTAGTAVVGTLSTNGLSMGVPAYLTTAALSQDSSKYAGTGTSATNASITLNTAGLAISVAAPSGGAGTGFTTATTAGTAIVGTLSTNGLSMGVPAYLTTAALSQDSSKYAGTGFTSTTTAGTAVVGTLTTNGLSLGVPAYLTTAALSQDSSKYAGTGTSATNASITLNTAGLAISVAAPSGGGAGTGFTTTTTAGTAIVGTLSTNGLSMGVPAFLTTAALSSQTLAFTLSGNSATTNSSQILNGGYALAGGNNITIQQSNNTISFSAPASSSLVGVSPVSLSSNGSTISVQLATMSEYEPYKGLSVISNSTLGQSSIYFVPFDVMWPVSGSRINFYLSLTHTYSGAPQNSTAWIAFGYGIYTRMTDSTDKISQLTTYSLSIASMSVSSSTRLSMTNYIGLSNATSHSTSQYGQNNATASNYLSQSVAGFRVMALPLNLTLTPGRYFLGVSNQTASQGASAILGMSVMQQVMSNYLAYRPFNVNSAASNASFYAPLAGLGSYSAQTAAWPATVALTTDAIRAAPAAVVPYFNISGISYSTNII